jgi:hypothetical protein
MGLFKPAGGARATVPTALLLFLSLYFLGNVTLQIIRSNSTNGAANSQGATTAGHLEGKQNRLQIQNVGKVQKQPEQEEGCDTIEDFIDDENYDDKSIENPWRQGKWGLPPARCRVNGHLIERLDPSYNYRRGVALGFTYDLDNKDHMEHWFLGTKVDFNQRKRRVLIDLGANLFHTSVMWFNTRYPCDFTEVHAFEADPNLFKLPEGFDEEANWVDPSVPGWKKVVNREGWLPKWMISRIHYYNKFVGPLDDEKANAVNITRFIKDELKLTEDDAVIVKMDIEGSEWPILKEWLKDPDMPKIIDELFLELHYYHPDNNWLEVKEYSREEATRTLAEMRFKGFYVHYWD